MDILIHGGVVVNEGSSGEGYLVVRGERIAEVGYGACPEALVREFRGERIDARGMTVMPGVIDDQVHFREPGLTYKGDIASESAAAVAGGVTSFMEMPNTKPPTTTPDLWEEKNRLAAATSMANYAFYFGATNENIADVARLDPHTTCGVKVFMGSSTGNMLVDDRNALSAIFAESPVVVATHCEDEALVREAMHAYRQRYGDAVPAACHADIRSAEACYRSTALAVELADRYGADLHVLHLSTARELALFDARPLAEKRITNEVCLHHLWFSRGDYARKGNLIKWNPSIKELADREALRAGLLSGKVDVVATDHAPHTLEEKMRPYWECPSGGPNVQHSLPEMLTLAGEGVFPVATVVEKMCHAPAARFRVRDRGYLRAGYFADIAIVKTGEEWTPERGELLYKCGWSPFEGERLTVRVAYTIVNGRVVNRNGVLDRDFRGAQLLFR